MGGKHGQEATRGNPKALDLFTEQNPSVETPNRQNSGSGQESQEATRSVSVEWFAKEQEAGTSDSKALDLFAEQSPPLEPSNRQDASSRPESQEATRSVSVEWFAKEQERLRAAGTASASAFWLAKGILWP